MILLYNLNKKSSVWLNWWSAAIKNKLFCTYQHLKFTSELGRWFNAKRFLPIICVSDLKLQAECLPSSPVFTHPHTLHPAQHGTLITSQQAQWMYLPDLVWSGLFYKQFGGPVTTMQTRESGMRPAALRLSSLMATRHRQLACCGLCTARPNCQTPDSTRIWRALYSLGCLSLVRPLRRWDYPDKNKHVSVLDRPCWTRRDQIRPDQSFLTPR